MSMRDLEGMIRSDVAMVLKNPKLRVKDLMEWRSSLIEPHEGEVVVKCETMDVWVAVKKELDKRSPIPPAAKAGETESSVKRGEKK